MNLKKVFLRNFKNYDKETLDLESSSFWILQGKNSSGKSTLACDALTYALFGKIKAMDDPLDTKISVDDIVKRGKTKATVRVEFSNKTDNYVIERIREIRKSNSKESVQIKKNNKIIHPRDATKTKGDQWIRNNLWSYKDFTNTTLIMQDEMTKALNLRTGERKDYLERLFGIKDFQEMAVLSREKSKEILGDLAAEDKLISDKKSRLIDKSELQTVKLELKNNLLLSEQNELDIKSKRVNKNSELQKRKSLEDELNNLKEDIIQDQKKLNQIETQIGQKDHQISKFQKVIENKDQMEESLIEIQKIEKQIEDLKVVKSRISSLEKLKISLLQQIENQEKAMKKEIIAKSNEIEKGETEKREYEEELKSLRELEADKPRIENALKNEKKVLQELDTHNSNKIIKLELQAKVGKKLNERDIKIRTFRDQLSIKQKEVDMLGEYQKEHDIRVQAKTELKTYELNLKSLNSDIKVVRDEIISKNTTFQVLKNSILTKENNMTDLEIEIKEIKTIHDHAECPTCKQSISSKHVDEIVSSLEVKKKSIQKEIKDTHSTTQLLENDINEAKVKLKPLSDKEIKTQSEIEDSRKASDGIDASNTQLKKIKNFQKELQEFENNGEIEGLYPELNSDILSLENQISNIIIDEKKLFELENEKNELIKKREILKNLNLQILKIESREIKISDISDIIFRNKEVIENLELELTEDVYSKPQRDEVSKTEDEIEHLSKDLFSESTLISSLIDLNPDTIRKRIIEIKEAEKSKDGLLGELKGIKFHYADLKKNVELNLKKTEEDNYIEIGERVAQSQIDLEEIEILYEGSIKQKQKAESELNQHLQLITTQEDLENEISSFEIRIKDKREDQDTYKHLEKIFQQIGGRILSRLRYQINVATIDILSLLGNLQLEGITLNEDFSITIQTPQGDERPSFFSGGQKVRIGFAFRLALSKVLAEFRGNELDTLIIDEGGFGALDEDGQEGVIDVFKSLQDRFERVIVISHIPKITNNLPGTQIQIDKGKIINRIN